MQAINMSCGRPLCSVFPAQPILAAIEAYGEGITDKTTREQYTAQTLPLRETVSAYMNGMQGRMKVCGLY